jgi:hypothetical protein
LLIFRNPLDTPFARFATSSCRVFLKMLQARPLRPRGESCLELTLRYRSRLPSSLSRRAAFCCLGPLFFFFLHGASVNTSYCLSFSLNHGPGAVSPSKVFLLPCHFRAVGRLSAGGGKSLPESTLFPCRLLRFLAASCSQISVPTPFSRSSHRHHFDVLARDFRFHVH